MKGIDCFYNRFVKRIVDIFCALIALTVFCWLYIIIAILVRIKMGSPIIFCQERPGKIDPKTGKEKIFKLYKFRSMTDKRDAEGRLLPDKARLTKFGRLLRATSLDELPEAINILKGDMSVIGPRPWVVSYLKYFTPEEHKRHLTRPGLSGWAQVNGRTASNWDERLRYDLEYIENVSLWFDVKIVFSTIKNVIFRSGIVEAGQQGDFSVYRERQWETGSVTKPHENGPSVGEYDAN